MKRYAFAVLALMALVLSQLATPQRQAAVAASLQVDLDAVTPQVIGEWRQVDTTPQAALGGEAASDKTGALYDNVLMRTYERASDGAIVWLVLATGGDQRGGFGLHIPEMCYRALGFEVENRGSVTARFDGRPGEIKRVLAMSPQRLEPISYWVLIDGQIVTREFGQKLRQLWYGLRGQTSQGTLVRISMPFVEGSIDAAYQEQQAFIEEMLRVWPVTQRRMVWPLMTAEKF